MQFEVLGPLGMRIDGREIAPTGRLQRLLLGSLLVHRNRPVPSDVLIELLWPAQPPDRAAARLQLHIHRLRQLLDTPDRLSRTPQGYQLTVAAGDLDTDRLDASLDAAMNAEHDPRTFTVEVRDALRLWRGTPYEGIDAPELEAEARRLTERKLAAMEAMYDAEISRGNVAEIVAELGDLAGQHPLRERLQAQLMTALARSGRRADALEVYRAARASYVEELGIEPGPELRGIHQAILAEDDDAPQDGGSVLTPAQLPLGISAFHGRERELTAIDAALDTRRICAISGTAGVGKTALALRWAHEHRGHFPDGQLYVDLRGFSIDTPAHPRDTLAAFLRAFGLTGAGVPGDLDERAARLRSILADRRVLIVLDNAASVEQVRPLLPGTPGCAVLVTSRESIGALAIREGAHRIELDRLSEDDSVTLLSNLLGDATYADPGSVRILAARCTYLPLALCIAAEQVRAMPARSVHDLVEEIDDEASRLDAFGTDTDVRAVFSWSYRALPADAATLFRQIGTITGRDVDEHALIAMSGLKPRTVRRAALSLVRAHLIDESPGHRYSQHDLLHVYACELSEDLDTSAKRAASQARLAAYYAYAAGQAADQIEPHTAATRPQLPKPPVAAPTFAGYDDALAWLETERTNILATAIAVDGEVWPHLGDLSALLDLFLWNSGHAADALMLETAARDATRRRGDITRRTRDSDLLITPWPAGQGGRTPASRP